MTSGFRREDERLLHQGHVISLGVGRFSSPEGETFERDLVHHPGAVSVVPLKADGRVVLVRQYRAALDADLLEIPAGKRDVPGEAPEVTAARELVEEVGWRAETLIELAQFYNSPGFCDEHSHVFLGTDLHPAPLDLQGIEEQHMTVEEVPLSSVPALIAERVIVDAKTIIGLLLTLRHVDG